MIAPSILSADFANLQKDIEMINASEATWIHADIMDGVFVPNISFGFPVLEAVARHAKKPIDAHLMIVHADPYIETLSQLGVALVSVHYEACPHLHRTLQLIKKHGMQCSVALNPHTPVDLLQEILPDLDMVLLMSVNPGFGNQQFIAHTYKKIAHLKGLIDQQGLKTLIQVDGGVNQTNARPLKEAGADILVAGGYVFNSPNPQQMISKLHAL